MDPAAKNDLATEFNICFWFQVHMAHRINSSRPRSQKHNPPRLPVLCRSFTLPPPLAGSFSWKAQQGFTFTDGERKQPSLCFGCRAVPSGGGAGS
ncbi:unnamed protein product [Pleuronectes platessa]|uniref:Uncharacterized protein n=1 Tax=Pleuronectes platessa TaxID=8262 RepID=A0A9N7TPW0_PLEPL|nr:unnamed protein product [Pleuronectes platessa]